MRTSKFRSPSTVWIRLSVGLGLLALICIQCSQPSGVVRSAGLATVAFAEEAPAQPDIAKLVELAKTDHIALLKLCLENCEQTIQDYTCTFVKRERIKGKTGRAQVIAVKFMDQPFSVAMRWRKNAPISDRCLFVEGEHDGNILLRPKGLLSVIGTVRRKPDSKDVMAKTLKPITLFGFRRGLEKMIEVYETADTNGDLVARLAGQMDVSGRPTVVLERLLPVGKDYPAYRTKIYIDTERLIPICIEAWDWDGELIGRYIYKDIVFNVGFTSDDFTPKANGL